MSKMFRESSLAISFAPIFLVLACFWLVRASRPARPVEPPFPVLKGDVYIGDDADIAVRAKLRIRYIGGSGLAKERDISVNYYNPDLGWIVGHCHLKDQQRTFYLDRIEDATDLETGEKITGVKFFLHRRRYG
jgi:hypothetical protein